MSYWHAIEKTPIISEIYDRLQKLALKRWSMLVFSQKIMFLFELSQKGTLQAWFLNDEQVR